MQTDLPNRISVSEMAKQVHLSRQRFNELVNQGIFLPPVKDERTGRPYYSKEAREKNCRVRRTGSGVNGQEVMFYQRRKKKAVNKGKGVASDFLCETVSLLREMGLASVTEKQVAAEIAALPAERQNDPIDLMVGEVFRRISRK